MKEITGTGDNQKREKQSIDLTIKLLLIVLLLAWCVMIILPFLIPILWGIILAITLFPVYNKLLKFLKGKKAPGQFTDYHALLLVLLIVPSVWLISALIKSSAELITALRDQTLVIPPPDPAGCKLAIGRQANI